MKLSVKYSATILSLILCVVIVFASVILIQCRTLITRLNASNAETLRRSVLAEIREKGITSARVMASALVNPLYQLDMLKMNELVSAVTNQPDVLYVYVYDNKRSIVVDGTKELESYSRILNDKLTMESARTARILTTVDGDAFHIAVPIWIQDEVIGGVKIGYSMKRVLSQIAKQEEDLARHYESVATQQLYTIGIFTLAFCIGGLIVAMLVARSWTHPISLLSNLTALVGGGNYDVSIPVNRADEIGQLASSFNDMVANLKRLRDKDITQSGALILANSELQRTNDELTNEIAERQRAQKKLVDHNRRMQVLHEINSAISSTLDRRILIDTLFDRIESLLPYSAITMRLFDKETNRLVPVSARNIDVAAWSRGLEAHTEIDGQGFSQTIFQNKQPVQIENVQTDPRCWNQELFRQHGLVAYIGVPIITEGTVLGVLGFYLREKHQFGSEETEFLSTLAGQVAVGLYNSQLYERLKTQAEKLETANRAKDEFLSIMSHELRTPLNVIMGYAQVLSTGIMGEVTPAQEKSLKKLMLHADDLLGMINDILQASKIQSGLVDAYIESVNITDLWVELESAYEVRSKQGVALTWQSLSALPRVQTDRSKLKHIIQNLVNNAIKFTEEGSVTITVRSIPNALEIKVEDTGIGIPSESLTSIFEMFRQADSSKTRTYGGAGVGLYIVKKFTDALNGQINVESVVGGGTTFTLTLPLTVTYKHRNPHNLDPILTNTMASDTYDTTMSSAHSLNPAKGDRKAPRSQSV